MLGCLRCTALRHVAEQVHLTPALCGALPTRWRCGTADAYRSHTSQSGACCRAAMAENNGSESGSLIRLAIVGDVHGFWYEEDAEALKALGVDAAIFLGDFSEEDVPLVERVASLSHPKAVILGNHDAWHSLTSRGRQRGQRGSAPRNEDRYDLYSGVEAQLGALGTDHVGYASKRFSAASGAPFSVVGGRPFSKGGADWTRIAPFYKHMYQIDGMDASADRIAQAITAQPSSHAVVVAAHNGPTGLGVQQHSICGADFLFHGGDHGDPDLEWALEYAQAVGRHVALVCFGHMHEALKENCRGLRDMVSVSERTGTVYLNAAVVPRVRLLELPANGNRQQHVTARHFVTVEIRGGAVTRASNVWLSQQEGAGQVAVGCDGPQAGYKVVASQLLLEALPRHEDDAEGAWLQRRVWRGHEQKWEVVSSPRRRTEADLTPDEAAAVAAELAA